MVLGRIAASILLPLATPAGDVAFSFDDPRIAESSGLVILANGNLVTTNDSGDVGRVFVVSPAGRTVRVAQWSDTAVDQESVAPSRDADRVWVGDTGDNGARRSDIVLSEVGVGAANTGRRYRTIRAVYPDGAHDAETLMRAPDGRLLVVTKGFLGGTLYAVPAGVMGAAGSAGSGSTTPASPVTLEQVSSPGAMLAMATDGAFFPDGKHFLVRGYVSATLYAWPSLERLGSMPLPSQRQGEGMAISADSTVWLTSEGARSKVLRIAVSEKLAGLMGRADSDADPSPGSNSHPSAVPTATPDAPSASAEADSGSVARIWPWLAGGVIGMGLLGYLARAWGSRRRRTG